MGVANRYIFSSGHAVDTIGNTLHIARGNTKSSLVVDEILKIFTPEVLMEWVIEDGQLIVKQKEAPEFGEFAPCQELNSFLEYLA